MRDQKGKKAAPNLHRGHRMRVREEFLARGLTGMADHRVLELLLFYAVPQGDVNPLAHALIDRFGDLPGVFDATYEQLLTVKGVGPNTASLIRLIPAVAARYMERRAEPGDQLLTSWQFQELLAPMFFGAREEKVILVCMDGKRKLLGCRELGAGIVNEAAITARKVLEAALDCNAVRVALAHNHVSGVAMYSNADVRATRELRALLRQVNIELVDHFVLANDDMVSMAESGALAEKSDD